MACSRTRDLAVHLFKHCLQLTFIVDESTFYLVQEVAFVYAIKPEVRRCFQECGYSCLKLSFITPSESGGNEPILKYVFLIGHSTLEVCNFNKKYLFKLLPLQFMMFCFFP